MQGFNKYYPPDYDPDEHASLNAYRGKHALGDRARKLDQGILITRFELPYHIWCGSCESIIAQGNRFNAEKKKVGNYYTTPIFSFKCKCPSCGSYFEIETDPKNSQYVVTSGARKKIEDWDPEENGGFAIHDPAAKEKAGADDPLAALEKSTDAQNHMNKVEIPRLEALQTVADQYGADPYALSRKVRKRFREEKKLDKAKQAEEDQLKGRYGLPEELRLAAETDETREQDKKDWLKAREELALRDSAKRRKLMSAPTSSRSVAGASTSSRGGASAADLLRARILGSAGLRKPSPAGRVKSR